MPTYLKNKEEICYKREYWTINPLQPPITAQSEIQNVPLFLPIASWPSPTRSTDTVDKHYPLKEINCHVITLNPAPQLSSPPNT